jgi:hypothetical protein
MRNSMIQHLGEGVVDSSMPLVMVGLSLAEFFRLGGASNHDASHIDKARPPRFMNPPLCLFAA